MTEPKRKRDGEIEVPRWVGYVTFAICWSLGIAVVLLAVFRGSVQIGGLGVFLILWPMSGFRSLEVVRDLAAAIGSIGRNANGK